MAKRQGSEVAAGSANKKHKAAETSSDQPTLTSAVVDDKAARKAAKRAQKLEKLQVAAKQAKQAYKAEKGNAELKAAYKAAKASVAVAQAKLLLVVSPASVATSAASSSSSTSVVSPTAASAGPDDEEAKYRAGLNITAGEGQDASLLPPCHREFSQGPWAKPFLDCFKAAGFDKPSPIQAQSWPIVLAGNDLIAVAKTGSGKTLGFLMPLFHALVGSGRAAQGNNTPAPLALVMAPTRELAMQIHAQVEQFGGPMKLSGLALYGGTPVSEQIGALKRVCPHIVAATPGRITDLLERNSLSLANCTRVVMDEADRMLDMGFEPQIKAIFGALPEAGKRQTLLFSATWPKSVRKLAATFLRNTATTTVFIGTSVDAELEANKSVSQTFIHATDDEKDKKLYDFLCGLEDTARLVIFANTKRRVENLSRTFFKEGWGTCAVHGDKTQMERDQALKKFVNHECPVMFATDVAARGLDIKGVTHVINFDMARDVETYVHRIGRTGRAGELGASVTFWNPDFDKLCAPALVKIARDANQEVPEWLAQYGNKKASKQWALKKAVLA